MKCPRCGHEMTLDTHRKIPMQMCYDCGYIEGRSVDDTVSTDERTKFGHLKSLGFNETVAFLSQGLGISEEALEEYLNSPMDL